MKMLLLQCAAVAVSIVMPLWGWGQAANGVVAVVNGQPVTEDELNTAAAPELEELELQRLQFEATFARERNAALESALTRIIEDRLLEAEAGRRNISVDDLIEVEVNAIAPIPGDAEVASFYEANRSRIGASFEQTRENIRMYLYEQEWANLFDALIVRLAAAYGVESRLDPVRSAVAVEGHPSKGPAAAPVTLVEFSDFECPFCASLLETLREVERNYPDEVRIVYRQFPLTSIHPNAMKAAEASLCANEQGRFWQLHDAMFAGQSNLSVPAIKEMAAGLSLDAAVFDRCLDFGKYAEAVQADLLEGTQLGIQGTPALFINGRMLGGAQPYSEIARIIEDELRRATGTN